MHDPLTRRARRIVTLASDIARRTRMGNGGDLAVLIAILEDDGGIAAAILRELGLSAQSLYAQLPSASTTVPAESSAAADIARVIALATEAGTEMKATALGTEHLLLAIVRDSDSAASKALSQANITEDAIHDAASRLA